MLQLRSVKVVTYLTGLLSNSKDASETRRSHPKKPRPISAATDPPARHRDLHFGGRDAPADGVEVTDGRRRLHLVHVVSLHARRRPRRAPRAA